MKEPRWDIDYSRGLVGENLLKDIIENAEVKTDYEWQKTGNLFIEFEAWREGKMQPSGIKTTEAKYWVFVLPVGDKQQILQCFPTSLIRRMCEGRAEVPMNNGSNPTKGYLIKISEIMNRVSEEANKGRKTA
jgi:hypothetical protein